MLLFMTRDYARYGIIDELGNEYTTDRVTCFAYDKKTDFKGEFPLGWYWTYNTDYVIRLPRNALGMKLESQARMVRYKEEKEYRKQIGAVDKDCPKCKGYRIIDPETGTKKCYGCPKRAKTYGLDQKFDSPKFQGELPTAPSPEELLILKEELDGLGDVLDSFEYGREMWDLMLEGVDKQTIADYFGLSLKGVYNRKEKLKAAIRANPSLKNLFKKP